MSVLAGDFAPELEDALNGVFTLLGISQNEAIEDAIKTLYNETDALAVLVVKVIIALFWWASHIGSATADALGYSAQIEDAIKKANALNYQTWQTWINIKHPEAIRTLYVKHTEEVRTIRRIIEVKQQVNLTNVWKAIHALQAWRTNTVDPELKNWRGFYALWRDDYKPAVITLRRWLASPSLFAAWATPPILHRLPTVLNESTQRNSATAVTVALTHMMQNNPQAVYDNVLTWLVTA